MVFLLFISSTLFQSFRKKLSCSLFCLSHDLFYRNTTSFCDFLTILKLSRDIEQDPSRIPGDLDSSFIDMPFNLKFNHFDFPGGHQPVPGRDNSYSQRSGLGDDFPGKFCSVLRLCNYLDNMSRTAFFHGRRDNCNVPCPHREKFLEQVTQHFSTHIISISLEHLDHIRNQARIKFRHYSLKHIWSSEL